MSLNLKSALKFLLQIFPVNFQLPSLQSFLLCFYTLSSVKSTFSFAAHPYKVPQKPESRASPVFQGLILITHLFSHQARTWTVLKMLCQEQTDLSSASQTPSSPPHGLFSLLPTLQPLNLLFQQIQPPFSRWSKRETQEASWKKLLVFPLLTVTEVSEHLGPSRHCLETKTLAAPASLISSLFQTPLPSSFPLWSPGVPGPCCTARQLPSEWILTSGLEGQLLHLPSHRSLPRLQLLP